MPLSTDIELPRGRKPVFPKMCIVCHQKPDSTIKLAGNSQNPLLAFLLPILMLFGWSRVEVPICQKCKRRFRFQRWGRELICFGLIIVLIWWLMPQFKGWSPMGKKLAGGGLVLLGILPWVLGEVFWPRIFDVTMSKKTVSYEFASASYAGIFAILNTGALEGFPGDEEPEEPAKHRDGP